MAARESARHELACPGFIAISWRNGNPDASVRKSEIDFQKSTRLLGSKPCSVLRASRGHAAPRGAAIALRLLLVVSQATPAALLCSAARECPFQGKILRDIFIRVRLMCPDNREGRKKSALLRGQSLGRMRSRRGYSLPPETGNRSDAFKLQGLVPCIFFVQSSA
jgi:hypothetical protein